MWFKEFKKKSKEEKFNREQLKNQEKIGENK